MANTSRFPTNPTSETKGSAQQHGLGAGSSLGQKTQDVASNLGHKAQDVASNLGQRAQDLASQAGDKAEDALSNVGEKISSLAGTIREKAPREGVIGSAAGAVADRLETGGKYLKDHGFSDMADDMSALIRQHPMQALLAGFGVGFLLGMAWRR